MAVADLDNVELLDYLVVKTSLIFLELIQQYAAKVDSQNIVETAGVIYLRFTSRDLVSQSANIALTLEECGDSFLSSIQALDIFLGVLIFLFELGYLPYHLFAQH